MSSTALKRSLQTVSQIVRQDTRFIRRGEHEVPLRREHGNSIRSRHFIVQHGQLLVASRLDALLEFLVPLNFAREQSHHLWYPRV